GSADGTDHFDSAYGSRRPGQRKRPRPWSESTPRPAQAYGGAKVFGVVSTASGDNEGRGECFQPIGGSGGGGEVFFQPISDGGGGRNLTNPREKGAEEWRVCVNDEIRGGIFRPINSGRGDHRNFSGCSADQGPMSDGRASHGPIRDGRADQGPMSDGRADHEPTSEGRADHGRKSDGRAEHGPMSGGRANRGPISVDSWGGGRNSMTLDEANSKNSAERGDGWKYEGMVDCASVAVPMAGGWAIDGMLSGRVGDGDGPSRGDGVNVSPTAGGASLDKTAKGNGRPTTSSRNSSSSRSSRSSSSSSSTSSDRGSNGDSRAVQGDVASCGRRPAREGQHRSPLNSYGHSHNGSHSDSNSDNHSRSNDPTTGQGGGGRSTASDDGRPRAKCFPTVDGVAHDAPLPSSGAIGSAGGGGGDFEEIKRGEECKGDLMPAVKRNECEWNDGLMVVEERRAGWTARDDGEEEGGVVAARGDGGGRQQQQQQRQQQQQQHQLTVRVVVNELLSEDFGLFTWPSGVVLACLVWARRR
ncbi:unnamed protein product, partial [Laminaria digitata]